MAINMEYLIKTLFVFCGLRLISGQIEPIVETSLGKVRGSLMETEKGTVFSAFRGIRYAEAPSGDKRFKPPIAIQSWFGEIDARRDGFMCPQTRKPVHLLSEDCLVLNVYTQNSYANQSVIVYIHGGGNIYGGSHSMEEAGPDYFMESDIVFVTMNFRLGAFGFLSTRTKEAPGNYGYLDQVMALKWIRDHISKFGGNPKSVTIVGFSAGAMDVTLHMASPLSQGLFHRAIAISGSATNEHVIDNLRWTQKLAHETSCPRFNAIDMLDCLRKLPWETIVSVCESWRVYKVVDMKFNYEIDGHFLTKRPTASFAEGSFSKIPIITGITKDEYIFSAFNYENDTGFLNDVHLNFEKYAPEFFMYNFEDPKLKKAEKVKNFYLENKTISEQNLTNFGAIFSDSLISHSVHRLVDLARKYVDVYFYRFDFHGSIGAFVDREGNSRGVSHGDDIQYIIKRQQLERQVNCNDPEWFMVERMVGVFTSFAQNGSPSNIDGLQWLPSNKNEIITLYIDAKVKLGSEPYVERFNLWDSLYPAGRSGSDVIRSKSLVIRLVVVFNLFKYLF